MTTSPQSQNEKSLRSESSQRVPKRVWLAAWLALVGAVVTEIVAIVNEGGPSATQMWSVAAPCISVAAMMAVVCYAIVKYR